MILRRSSSRCSRKLIAGISSLVCPPAEGSSAAISGIGSLTRQVLWSGRRQFVEFFRVAALNFALRRLSRRQNLGGRRFVAGFGFQVVDFRLDLGLELVASPLELVECLAQLPANLR